VSPDDDSRFDRTVSPSPACPKETLQQCGVSRIVQIHVPVLLIGGNAAIVHTTRTNTPHTPQTVIPTLINFLEQAAQLGYNTLHLTGGDHFLTGSQPYPHEPTTHILEDLLTTSHKLGYHNTATQLYSHHTALHSQHAARILQNLDHITITIDGKPVTNQQRDAFARMRENLTQVKNFSFSHTLTPDSWQILSWLTDFAIHHKATSLHLQTRDISTFSAVDLYRIYLAHYYLKSFAEPELLIHLDLLHRDNLINNPNFLFHQTTISKHNAEVLSKLIIGEKGDILTIPGSTFFKIGNIHDTTPLSTMIDQFMEKKLEYIMQLYNDTYREILADPGVEIFSWHQLIIDKSRKFEDSAHEQD